MARKLTSDGYCPPLRDPHVSKPEFLMANGYLDADPKDVNKISEKDSIFKRATAAWQDLADIPITGEFDAISVSRTFDKCCALPDLNRGFVKVENKWVEWSVESACTRKWATKNLTCTHNMRIPTMSDTDVHKAWWQAKLNWMAVCGIVFEFVPYEGPRSANFVHEMEAMDGSSGKLAYHFLPNCGQAGNTTLFGRFDSGERWTFDFLMGVGGHEDGHGLGLSHDTSREALLYPYFQRGVLKPTARDAARVVNLYGKPVDIPTGPGPTDPPRTPSVEQRVLNLEMQVELLWQLMKTR